MAFIEDYDLNVSRYMVQGSDVWLNNPRRPLEACGTSGMKASLNGVLNLSTLDGWWIEGYNGKNGWVFGGAPSDDNRDRNDAGQLYDILEREVVPLYYKVSVNGIPHIWVKKMKETIKSTASRFSARRMVKEYVRQGYLPALMAEAKYKKGKI